MSPYRPGTQIRFRKIASPSLCSNLQVGTGPGSPHQGLRTWEGSGLHTRRKDPDSPRRSRSPERAGPETLGVRTEGPGAGRAQVLGPSQPREKNAELREALGTETPPTPRAGLGAKGAQVLAHS